MATRKTSTQGQPRGAGRARAAPGRGRARGRGTLAPPSGTRGLEASRIAIPLEDPEIAALVAQVQGLGGVPIGAYHEPLGGRALLLASLPLAAVQPTPFQRDLSPTHCRRLAAKIEEASAYLDPLIVVRGEEGQLWTPNGRHRLAAAELLTLGIVYEKAARFAGGAYSAFLKKVDRFSERTLAASLREREGFAARLIAIEAQVRRIMATLQARGFRSPYLRNYVVARINPVRFHNSATGASGGRDTSGGKAASGSKAASAGRAATKPPMPLAQALTRMMAAARTFRPESVSSAELAWVAVGADSGGD